MSFILSSLLSYVLIYKYLAIFVITFLGAFALPLPSGSMLMAAAAFSTQGYLNFYLVFLFGLLGNLAGDNAGYWLVRKYGIKVLQKLHLHKFFKQDKLDSARNQLHNHPMLTIFSSRFLTAIAPAVNVVAGISGLPYKRYLFFEALGELAEVTFFCVWGYIFGSNWEYVSQLSGWLLVLVIASMVMSVMLWKMLLKKK